MKALISATGLLALCAPGAALLGRRLSTNGEFENTCKHLSPDGKSMVSICHEQAMLAAKCTFGRETYETEDIMEEKPQDQQRCFSGSEFWDMLETCTSCYRLVQPEERANDFPDYDVRSLSAAYCNNGPVTIGFPKWQSIQVDEDPASLAAADNASGTQVQTRTGAITTSKAATASRATRPGVAMTTAASSDLAATTSAVSAGSFVSQYVEILALVSGLAMAAELLEW